MFHPGLIARRPRLHLQTLAALIVACCVALISAHAASAAPSPFAPSSVWNTPLASNAPIDSNSSGLVGELLRQKNTSGTWINTTPYSTPVYTVDTSVPSQYVTVDGPQGNPMYTNATDAANLQQQLRWVPIPAGAVQAAGVDGHMVIYRPSTDQMWELWRATNWGTSANPVWHAQWGAKINNVSTNDGRVPAPFGATASGQPLLGGLIRASELYSGHIDHAISLAVPDVQRWKYVWPSTRTDGTYTGPNAIPEGQRFRLPASLDIASLNLPPVGQMIAQAAQKYGIILRDGGGAVTFFAEDPTPFGFNPYNKLFGGLDPSQILANFPWSKLQALQQQTP